VTVVPEFVNVDYNYLNVYADVYYDKTKTSGSSDSIASTVRNAILSYSYTDLNDFNSKFKMSKLLRSIDDSDNSISFSDAAVTITKKLEPVIGVSRNYTLNYGTAISREDPHYKIFSAPAFREYDNDGVLRQCFFEEVPGKSTGVESISVIYAPTYYEDAPTVTIAGDGIGAMATPVIVNGRLTAIDIVNSGVNYTTATASVYYRGVLDSTVSLNVSIRQRYGTLQTYFFDDNNNKTVLTADAGDVDYYLGKITLTAFNPVSIDDPLKVMRITAKSVSNNFESSKQRILTIDGDDSASINIKIKPIE
jgi:hypothetical protein